MNYREMDIYENELKFIIQNKNQYASIYNYLCKYFLLCPYRKSQVVDYYYDYQGKLLKKGISYRIRYRPNASLNLKISGMKTGYINSRHEYSFKTENKDISNSDMQNINCVINNLLKKKLELNSLDKMEVAVKLVSERICFTLYSREKDILGNYFLLGWVFFDSVENTFTKNYFYEFELEASTEKVSPYTYEIFNKIGNELIQMGYEDSKDSKYERAMTQINRS